MKYFNSKILPATTIEAVRPKVEEALKAEGFGVLTEIDIQATMKKKLDKEYLPHIILGACSPSYADKVLMIDPNISTMLPCNVTIRQLENGDVEVAAIDPLAAMSIVNNDKIETYAKEVNENLQRVLESI